MAAGHGGKCIKTEGILGGIWRGGTEGQFAQCGSVNKKSKIVNYRSRYSATNYRHNCIWGQ